MRSTSTRKKLGKHGACVALVGIASVVGYPPGAVAQTCPGGGGLASVGELNQFGFPGTYTDINGVTLGMCIDNTDPLCLLEPLPDPGAELNVADGNFFGESFYWQSEATVPTSGGQGLLVMAIEAVWGGPNEEVIAGDQTVFSRLRIRIDGLSPGTYTVTHPFGVDEFEVAAGGIRVVNHTDDCLHVIPASCAAGTPNAFTTALDPVSPISTFLSWDPAESLPPEGYLGDPAVPHTITGSPCGTNFFRIEAPDIGGIGVDMVETNIFTLMGKLSTLSTCGNGVVEGLEECDDGNAVDGDCCSATCQFEAADTSCEANVCVLDGTCDGAGLCEGDFNDGVTCDDGNVCTTNVCLSGVCEVLEANLDLACDDGSVCTMNDVCDAEGVCGGEPTTEDLCVGVECGDDGCGVSCGTCAGFDTCDVTTGTCSACEPDCIGLACGDDGCGGTCGTCAADELCTAGVCELDPSASPPPPPPGPSPAPLPPPPPPVEDPNANENLNDNVSDGSGKDSDDDGVDDVDDNCPTAPNPEQSDVDSDGLGDVCDLTDDRVQEPQPEPQPERQPEPQPEPEPRPEPEPEPEPQPEPEPRPEPQPEPEPEPEPEVEPQGGRQSSNGNSTPTGVCGLFGMVSLCLMTLGLAGMKVRVRRSRRRTGN